MHYSQKKNIALLKTLLKMKRQAMKEHMERTYLQPSKDFYPEYVKNYHNCVINKQLVQTATRQWEARRGGR